MPTNDNGNVASDNNGNMNNGGNNSGGNNNGGNENEAPYNAAYAAHIAHTAEKEAEAREGLKTACMALYQARKPQYAAVVEIGKRAFGENFTLGDPEAPYAPLTPAEHNHYACERLGWAWALLVRTDKVAQRDEVKAIGGEIWGADGFSNATNWAIENI